MDPDKEKVEGKLPNLNIDNEDKAAFLDNRIKMNLRGLTEEVMKQKSLMTPENDTKDMY